MNQEKVNLLPFSFISSVYDIESNIFNYMRNKYQNFLLSINRLFINNNWYNNTILKFINIFLQKKFFPLILSGILFIKSKISPFISISEDFFNIHIQNKNKLILFLLLNSFETLTIKYIDQLFIFCYRFFFRSHNYNEKVKYYGKCLKNIFKNFKNIQNIIMGMNYYKFITPKENKEIYNGFDIPIKFIGFGFIIKNVNNIFCNITNIYKIYCLPEEKEITQKNNDMSNENKIKEEEEDDNKENICLLCLNKFNNTCCTPCGHLFCWSCIHLYLIEKNNCPKCKKEIKPQEILFLQNYYI